MEKNVITAISEYQTQKTIRFGLTATNQNLYSEEVIKLLNLSEKRIKEQVEKVNDNLGKNEQLRSCLVQIKEYLKLWGNTYPQIDFWTITKDYYRVISRKAKFDFDKEKGSEINLSSLRSTHNNKKYYLYIIDFWRENLRNAGDLYRKSDDLLKLFEEVSDDKKLNKVELRKTFLSLFNLVNETLKPLIEGNLYIANDYKIDEQNSKHNYVMDFISKTEKRKLLYGCICDLQNHFKDNGGYVPFGRATLNKWTAQQKPHIPKDKNGNNEIDKIISFLKPESVSIQNVDYNYDAFSKNFEYNNKEKKYYLQSNAKSVIELCQFFKYKKIPINARLNLAERLQKDTDFLSEFGVSKSPALDYKKDKDNFNLTNYPLKVAFDYAWENCAKAKYESNLPFPEEMCKNYLKDVFGLDVDSSPDFTKYAVLLHFKILIGRIKAEESTRKENIKTVKGVLDCVKNHLSDKEKKKTEIISEITNWITFKENQTNKEEKYKKQDEFSLSMKIIGQERGGLKNRIPKYKTLTEMFKVCASKFGKQFADLRDYFNEAYEVDKIIYRSWIIEDEKQNRFVLFVNKEKKFDLISEKGNLTIYEVKSLTSKSLVKFIKNKGAYPDFHNLDRFYYDKIKRDWQNYKNDPTFLTNLKQSLSSSKMANEQNWKEFDFDFSKCDTYEKIEKEIDRKGYKLKQESISIDQLNTLIENQKCFLLPIINQDINREDKQTKNQFSKDWNDIFTDTKRLHPEFNLFYRLPTKDYPNTKLKNGIEKTKRYSRFQILAHFGCEVIPQGAYLSKKEQISIFNDDKKQKEEVEKYNKYISSNFDYVIGIDRGVKQLATLCVLDRNGTIQGNFQIFTRTFNSEKKRWEHEKSEERNILDLSNLRVETTITGEKVLVDLSKIKDNEGNYTNQKQTINLKQLAYIRELQYAMQNQKKEVLDFVQLIKSVADITEENIKNFISPYKDGKNYADLPKREMFNLLKEWENANDEEKRVVAELDPADNLKSGIVANMVGVVAFLCEKYNYQIRIALEDLTRSYGIQKDILSGTTIYQNDEDFKEQENRRLAGVGTMQFFEVQLLRKLFKIQVEKNLHLIPAFRSVANYEKIVRRDKQNSGDEFVNYPFGVVCFVDPKYTSKRCPKCGKTNATRKENVVICKEKSCGFQTKERNPCEKNNIHFITDGDQNGAYHIAKKALRR